MLHAKRWREKLASNRLQRWSDGRGCGRVRGVLLLHAKRWQRRQESGGDRRNRRLFTFWFECNRALFRPALVCSFSLRKISILISHFGLGFALVSAVLASTGPVQLVLLGFPSPDNGVKFRFPLPFTLKVCADLTRVVPFRCRFFRFVRPDIGVFCCRFRFRFFLSSLLTGVRLCNLEVFLSLRPTLVSFSFSAIRLAFACSVSPWCIPHPSCLLRFTSPDIRLFRSVLV